MASTGEFGFIHEKSGEFEPLFDCPGFPRGLAFINNYAVIGKSSYRDERLFHGSPIEKKLGRFNREPIAGISVVNLKNGRLEYQMVFSTLIQELYDVAIMRDTSPSIYTMISVAVGGKN